MSTLRLTAIIALFLAFERDSRADAPPPSEKAGAQLCEELVNRCITAKALKFAAADKSGAIPQSKIFRGPRLEVADSGKLRKVVEANRQLVTSQLCYAVIGCVEMADDAEGSVFIQLLRQVGEVGPNEIGRRMAPILAARRYLPRRTPEGIQNLQRLVHFCEQAGGLTYYYDARLRQARLELADAKKLKQAISEHADLVTPAVLDTLEALRDSIDHSVLLRAIANDTQSVRVSGLAFFLEGQRHLK